MNRKEKKHKKKLADLDKELLEAKGEESKQQKEMYFTDATKIVFTIFFRVLKSFPRSSLMGKIFSWEDGFTFLKIVLNLPRTYKYTVMENRIGLVVSEILRYTHRQAEILLLYYKNMILDAYP